MEDDKNSLARDGGYASRKFWFALISSVLVLVASRISPVAALPEIVAGLVMICSIYVAGNAVVRWRSGQIEQTKVEAKIEAEKIEAKAEAKVEATKAPEVKPEDDERG
jgi:hypothetical protein